MKGITGSPQKAAWLQSEFESRPIEQERMARARIEIELTLSLDAMISLEEKRHFNFPPYPTFASNLGSVCKEFSGERMCTSNCSVILIATRKSATRR